MSGPTRHALLLHINPYDTLWQSITTTDDYLFIHSAFTIKVCIWLQQQLLLHKLSLNVIQVHNACSNNISNKVP